MDGHIRAWNQARAPGPEVSPETATAWVNTVWPATRAPLRHEPRRLGLTLGRVLPGQAVGAAGLNIAKPAKDQRHRG